MTDLTSEKDELLERAQRGIEESAKLRAERKRIHRAAQAAFPSKTPAA